MGPAGTTQSPRFGKALRIVDFVRQRRWVEALAVLCLSGIIFGVLMKLAMVLLFGNGIAVCWPMVGMVTAVMLKMPRRLWPWLLVGVACGHLYAEPSYSWDEMLVNTVCDVLETLIAALALPEFVDLADWLRRPNLLRRFVLWPVLLGPIVTSLPVAYVFAQRHHGGLLVWAYHWLFADSLGVLLWLPLSLVLLSPETYRLFRIKELPRTTGLMGLLLVVGVAIFEYKPSPLAYVMMPLLLMVALRLGFSGSAIAVNVLSLITAVATLHGHGPFASIDAQYRVMALQAFLAVCMIMCFPISLILLERDAFERELREALDGMHRLATNDALTGLANRRQFDTVLESEWKRAARVNQEIGLLMMDVDCFKRYNDSYGHVAGDECLRRIAECIGGGAARAGDLVGRYGGEEFFALMPNTGLPGLLQVAEGIRHAVEAQRLEHRENPGGVVTISIGCCSKMPGLDEKPESLVEAADQALYAAKQGGRNRVAAFELPKPEEKRPVLAMSA